MQSRVHARANDLNKKRIGATASIAEKALLTRKTTLEANKNSDDDDDDNVAIYIKKKHNNQPKCGVCRSNNVE